MKPNSEDFLSVSEDTNKQKNESLFKGHRERLRNRYLQNGLESLNDYEKLELLLFYSVPRKNTNDIAHKLINEFNSLKEVFYADSDDLFEVESVGESTVTLIKLVGDLLKYLKISDVSKKKVIESSCDAGEFVKEFFEGYRHEVFMAFFLDKGNRVLGHKKLSEGIGDEVKVETNELIRAALKYKATNVIIAHNHPGGSAVPSNSDVQTTKILAQALSFVKLKLNDHIIVADDGYISFLEMNLL